MMMKLWRYLFALPALVLALFYSTPAFAALPAAIDGQPMPTLAPMLERVAPAVVNIATVGSTRVRENPLFNDPFFRRFFDLPNIPQRRQTQSLGSGVVVDSQNGYILTNHHVIAHAEQITVTLRDGRQLTAKLIGTDPDSDVAVVQIDADNLTETSLGDSDGLLVGDFVVAIGNPFGLGQTVTSGIVSALGRSGLGIEGYEDFIQTDASINPGNSGGALVNLRGELVGINTAILAPSGGNVGIGFAIPVNMARQLMQQLIEHGEVRRGSMGITAQDLTPELAKAFNIKHTKGTVIAKVASGSPAAEAGLRVGDVVIAVDGRPVRNAMDVRNRIGLLRVNTEVALDILRDGKQKTVKVRITEPKLAQADGAAIHPRLAGAVFAENQPDLLNKNPQGGVAVVRVEPGSQAWYTGLREGDVIASVNRQTVRTASDMEKAAQGRRELLLNIQRGDTALFVVIQ